MEIVSGGVAGEFAQQAGDTGLFRFRKSRATMGEGAETGAK